jgi:hypothetical protein
MAVEEHFEMLISGSERWNRWRLENPLITPDLSGIELVNLPTLPVYVVPT